LGVFGLCQIHAFVDYVRSRLSNDNFKRLFKAILLTTGAIVAFVGMILTISGKILISKNILTVY